MEQSKLYFDVLTLVYNKACNPKMTGCRLKNFDLKDG